MKKQLLLTIAIFSLLTCFSAYAENSERVIVHFNSSKILSGKSLPFIIRNLQSELEDNINTLPSEIRTRNQINKLWAARAIAINLTSEEQKKLCRQSNVSQIEPADTIIPSPEVKSDPEVVSSSWGLDKINASRVWNELGIDGSGAVVGQIDSGVFYYHPELEGQISVFRDFTKIATGEEKPAYDNTGHGTHTAGTICGRRKSIGIAPGARLVVAKLFDPNAGAPIENMLSAMQWMLDPDGNPDTNDAPQVVNNSWSANGNSTNKTFWETISTWNVAGIVGVFSAGNQAYLGNKVDIPGAYPHSFAIGATDENDKVTYFSQPGPASWNNELFLKPDVSAPGLNIISSDFRGGYSSMSGTSMSAPHASGLIALIHQANPNLSVSEIVDLCRKNSFDIEKAGPDNKSGYGRIDAMKTVKAALASTTLKDRISALPLILEREKLHSKTSDNRMSASYIQSLLKHGASLTQDEFAAESAAIGNDGNPYSVKILRKINHVRLFNQMYNSLRQQSQN
ncbi:MAG: S8 family serine peptidase [Candidatus Riflebacteria bacterium]|nr:S8 family serine peptidase [Candidatus Riflebacteria bacterium]